MKIIMVRSHPVNPDVRLEKEAASLSNDGYEVLLFGWDRFGNSSLREKKNGYTIRRLRLKAPIGIKVVFYLPLWWIFEFFWLMSEKWDVVHTADLDTYVPALIAAKIKRKRIVYDIFDFYTEEIPLPKKIQHFLSQVDRFLMKFADIIIIPDESRRHKLENLADKKNILVLYNSPVDQKKTYGNQDLKRRNIKFRIFFAGVLQKDRDFATILNLARKNGDIQVEIAGWGECADQIKKMASTSTFLTFSGILSYDEVLDRTMNADLLFALYNPSTPNNKFASPNKLFEAMMCKKPIVVSDGTSMSDIVRRENCGLIVPFGDIDAIEHALLSLKDDPNFCNRLGENGRKAYEQQYSWKIMEKRLLNTYNEILN